MSANDRLALLREIAANPENQVNRLILADWYEDANLQWYAQLWRTDLEKWILMLLGEVNSQCCIPYRLQVESSLDEGILDYPDGGIPFDVLQGNVAGVNPPFISCGQAGFLAATHPRNSYFRLHKDDLSAIQRLAIHRMYDEFCTSNDHAELLSSWAKYCFGQLQEFHKKLRLLRRLAVFCTLKCPIRRRAELDRITQLSEWPVLAEIKE